MPRISTRLSLWLTPDDASSLSEDQCPKSLRLGGAVGDAHNMCTILFSVGHRSKEFALDFCGPSRTPIFNGELVFEAALLERLEAPGELKKVADEGICALTGFVLRSLGPVKDR